VDHLTLLKEWIKAKPGSPTAAITLASAYVGFAWSARGDGFANTVEDKNLLLFEDRLKTAKEILDARKNNPGCPRWYSVMQVVGLGQKWNRSSYEALYEDAIAFEPTWYEYYQRKAVYLLPRWYGQDGEARAYIDSLSRRAGATDNAMVYFLTNEYASAYDEAVAADTVSSYPLLKDGFETLRKSYGVTGNDVHFVFSKARQMSDAALVQELLPQVESDSDFSGPLTKEKFERIAKAVEELKARAH